MRTKDGESSTALTEIEKLLEPLLPEAPCGADLSYDAAFMETERLIPGKPEVQAGDEKHPAEEPSWGEVRAKSLELLGRTKDLRVVMWLTVAMLRLEGITGLRDGLGLLRGVLERFWETVHPQLDPDEGNDPLMRLNIISWLSPRGMVDDMKFGPRLREAPLCTSRRLRRNFSYRDVCIARGEIAAGGDGGQPPADQAIINGAFDETSVEELLANARALSETKEHIRAIEAVLGERVGAEKSPDLSGFVAVADRVSQCLQEQLDRRGYAKAEGPGRAAQPGESGGHGREAAAATPSGEIRSTQDVLVAIDKICRYYEKSEPSSPVPLLLRRAQRLVSKNFMEIIKDLSPDTMGQLDVIVGVKEGQTKEGQ